MYCSYHQTNAARSRCANCARPLCAACDHRIKGYPYCQDCIVLGISYLSRSYRTASPRKSKAWLATLCAMVLPGLGAVYNRQNVKAVAHFIAVAGLFQFAGLLPFSGLFRLAGLVLYVHSIIDACRTAKMISEGESAAENEARFKRALARRAPAIGLVLVVSGLISIIQIAQPFGLTISLPRLLPVLLVFLGGYLLTRYFKRSRQGDYPADKRPPLIPARFVDRKDSARASHHGDYR